MTCVLVNTARVCLAFIFSPLRHLFIPNPLAPVIPICIFTLLWFKSDVIVRYRFYVITTAARSWYRLLHAPRKQRLCLPCLFAAYYRVLRQAVRAASTLSDEITRLKCRIGREVS